MKKLIIFLVFILSGCATQIPLSCQDAKKIRNIRLDPGVCLPEGMLFNADGAQFTTGFGLIGAVIHEDIAKKDIGIIQSVAASNGICLEKIILSQMTMSINNLTPYHAVGTYSNTYMKLKILEYGFVGCFSNKLSPIMTLEAQVYSDNKLICQNNVTVNWLSASLPSYSMNEISTNPRLLDHMWQNISAIATKKLTLKLLKEC